MCCDSLALPASLEGVGAESELRTTSSKDDMVCLWRLYLVLFVAGNGIEAGVLARGSVNTRNAGRAGWIGKSNYLVRACYHHVTKRCYSAVIYVANMFKVVTVVKVIIRVLIRNAFVDTTKVEMATMKGYTAYPVHPKRNKSSSVEQVITTPNDATMLSYRHAIMPFRLLFSNISRYQSTTKCRTGNQS
jgi:hypothetical protein